MGKFNKIFNTKHTITIDYTDLPDPIKLRLFGITENDIIHEAITKTNEHFKINEGIDISYKYNPEQYTKFAETICGGKQKHLLIARGSNKTGEGYKRLVQHLFYNATNLKKLREYKKELIKLYPAFKNTVKNDYRTIKRQIRIENKRKEVKNK